MGCTGKCCEQFTFPSTPKELRDRWYWYPSTSVACRDDRYIAEMLIPLGVDDEGEAHYTCKHYDTETKLCKNYAERPKMCKKFPYGRECPNCDCKDS